MFSKVICVVLLAAAASATVCAGTCSDVSFGPYPLTGSIGTGCPYSSCNCPVNYQTLGSPFGGNLCGTGISGCPIVSSSYNCPVNCQNLGTSLIGTSYGSGISGCPVVSSDCAIGTGLPISAYNCPVNCQNLGVSLSGISCGVGINSPVYTSDCLSGSVGTVLPYPGSCSSFSAISPIQSPCYNPAISNVVCPTNGISPLCLNPLNTYGSENCGLYSTLQSPCQTSFGLSSLYNTCGACPTYQGSIGTCV